MTTLERLARLACVAALTKLKSSRPETAWEDQSPENKEVWIAAIRAAVEGMLDLPQDIQDVVRKSPAMAGYGMYRIVIQAILEEPS